MTAIKPGNKLSRKPPSVSDTTANPRDKRPPTSKKVPKIEKGVLINVRAP
jgi:hypothetical protein